VKPLNTGRYTISRWSVLCTSAIGLGAAIFSLTPSFPFPIGLRVVALTSAAFHFALFLFFNHCGDRTWDLANYFNITLMGFAIHYSGGIASPFLIVLVFIPLTAAGYGMKYRHSLVWAVAVYLFVIAGEYFGIFSPILFTANNIYGNLFVTILMTSIIIGYFGISISIYNNTVEYLQRTLDMEHVQREKMLIKLSRMEAPSQAGLLAEKVTHDVRGSLGALKGFIDMLSKSTSLVPEEKDDCLAMQQELGRIGRLLQQTLQYLKKDSGEAIKLRPAEVIETVLSVIRYYPGARGIQFRKNIGSARNCWVLAHKEQLQQVYFNLLKNAIEALQDRPEPRIIEVAACEDNGMLKVAIRDNGPAIAPDLLGKLTRECVSTKEDGSGLGLLLAREIMESHRGDLKVATRPEGGAEVSTWLPLLTAPEKKTEAAA